MMTTSRLQHVTKCRAAEKVTYFGLGHGYYVSVTMMCETGLFQTGIIFYILLWFVWARRKCAADIWF